MASNCTSIVALPVRFTFDEYYYVHPTSGNYYELYDQHYTYYQYNLIISGWHATFPIKCTVTNCNGKICGTGIRTSHMSWSCSSCNIWTVSYDIFLWWDWERNINIDGTTINPFCMPPAAKTKMWFRCINNANCGCHRFDCALYHFKGGKRCPYCQGKKVCIHDSIWTLFPDIQKYWDFKKNREVGNLEPWEIPPYSNARIWLKCTKNTKCDCHRYETFTRRFSDGHRCPYCTNLQTCPHDSIWILEPDVQKQWDFNRNRALGLPEPWNIPPGSAIKCWFICDKNKECDCHVYEMQINVFTRGCRCQYCNGGKKTCIHKSAWSLTPEFQNYWDPDKNRFYGNPEPWTLARNSHLKCWFKCSKNHSFRMQISVFNRGCRCKRCSLTGYSKISISWLNYFQETNTYLDQYNQKSKYYIQHAENGGEVKLPGIPGSVDGYIASHNIVLEFYGCLFHGCPKCKPDRHKMMFINKTPEQVYQKTLTKSQKINLAGYHLIEMWECNFREIIAKTQIKVELPSTEEVNQEIETYFKYYEGIESEKLNIEEIIDTQDPNSS